MTNKYSSEYETLFNALVITPAKMGEVDTAVTKINAGMQVYQQLEKITGVPWFMIGVIHYMEASCNFSKHLHNGDPLTARTVNVPAGRPTTGKPPFTFIDSATDAIKYQKLDQNKDWSIMNILYLLEAYNGFGYHTKGINSPYLWSYSNLYTKGKYVADGVYDANAVSKQAGAAVIMYRVLQRNNLLAKYLKAAAGGAALLLAIGFFF